MNLYYQLFEPHDSTHFPTLTEVIIDDQSPLHTLPQTQKTQETSYIQVIIRKKNDKLLFKQHTIDYDEDTH